MCSECTRLLCYETARAIQVRQTLWLLPGSECIPAENPGGIQWCQGARQCAGIPLQCGIRIKTPDAAQCPHPTHIPGLLPILCCLCLNKYFQQKLIFENLVVYSLLWKVMLFSVLAVCIKYFSMLLGATWWHFPPWLTLLYLNTYFHETFRNVISEIAALWQMCLG